MGVTLERVQNKFACIIGELCNEPDILSQFAIWVDLRIAEYKAKGAISLDCSGENPNPTWLRGFRPPSKERTLGKNFPFSRKSHFSPRDASSLPADPASWDQHSPLRSRDDEPSDLCDVFHRGEALRKRPQSDFSSSYLSHTDNGISPAKSQKLDPSQIADFPQSINQPTNESLMSIIGADQEPEVIETSTIENVDSSEITIVLDNDQSDLDTTPSTSAPGEITLTENMGGNSSQTSDATLWTDMVEQQHTRYWDTSSNAQALNFFQDSVSSRELTALVSKRISPNRPKSQQTTKNLVSAVITLERWMRQSHGDNRQVETVPPEELDGLLCQFFSAIKLPSGADYSAEGLKNIRCSLARFMEEANYHHRITRSPLFEKSQCAFRAEYRRKAFLRVMK